MKNKLDADGGQQTKKMCPENKEVDAVESFLPREYQIELLEASKKENTIACLGTGTGKTFIAVMLIREMSHQVQPPFEDGGKRIFLLVPTVPLVHQQADVVKRHTELKVGRYFGEMGVDTWNKEDWSKEFIEQQVLVMTAEICRIILFHGFLPLSKICLLIFDECHRAQKNHPYREIMRMVADPAIKDGPRIFGLSASLVNRKCKPTRIEIELEKLEKTLSSKIVTASDYEEVRKYGTDPKEILIMYKIEGGFAEAYSGTFDEINQGIIRLATLVESKDLKYKAALNDMNDDSDINFFRKPRKCAKQLLDILNIFGPWAMYFAAGKIYSEVERLVMFTVHKDETDKLQMWENIKSTIQSLRSLCEANNFHIFQRSLHIRSHKVERLLQIFSAFRKLFEVTTQQQQVQLPSHLKTFQEDPCQYNYQLNSLDHSLSDYLCGIVFVEQRVIAHIMCEWLRNIASHVEEFSFLKPNFIVGHGCMGTAFKESSMSVQEQRKILKGFRERESNVLIATSVLEEGVDVQKCNLVVRFDKPKDFRSYVQSKGRARAQNSKYCMLLPVTESAQFVDDLCNYKAIERRLLMKVDKEMPSEEACQEHLHSDEALPPYKASDAEGAPRISLSSSVSLLHRYCTLLPSDKAAKLRPHWNLKQFFSDTGKKQFQCDLRLPINCPLRKTITGQPMDTKKGAKMAAALEACKMLHQIGELNDNLLPFSTAVEDAAKELVVEEDEESSTEKGQPGTNSRRQNYRKAVAECLQHAKPLPGRECFLHVLIFDLVVPLPKSLNPRGRPIVNPADTTKGFGLLCNGKLPQVCRFPIFTKIGKIMVSVKCVNSPVVLDSSQAVVAENFHRFLFSESLFLERKEFSFSPDTSERSFYIVPVDRDMESNYCIDWEFMMLSLKHEYNTMKQKSKEALVRQKFDKSLFDGAVVTRAYLFHAWEEINPVFHIVNNIRYDMNPQSPLSQVDSVSFDAYYEKRYNVTILDKEQPMLDVDRVEKMNFNKPLYVSLQSESKSEKRHRDFREYLVPELCILHPFPSYLFRKASYIPTALYRLNQLLLAEELRQAVASEVNVGRMILPEGFYWPDFNFERSDEKLIQCLVSRGELSGPVVRERISCNDIIQCSGKILSFEAKVDLASHPGPSPSTLLQALTTTSAGDEFNLERLEVIGDSFLKYATSVKLHADYPKFDEGKLTALRMRLIRNLHLHRLSKNKHLPQMLAHSRHDCKNTWLPPCYEVRDGLDVKAAENFRGIEIENEMQHRNNIFHTTFQRISDKCTADAVEALIGSYLLSCGQQGALRFMYWLGLNAFATTSDGCSGINFDDWPPKPADPVIEDHANDPNRLTQQGKFKILSGFEEFEKRLGYKFNDRAYLLQAFTHPSYFCNEITDCYQRLEFLGDAVLDYLITRKLYEDPVEHSPGELTDLRAAMVNNGYFASLAVKHGYNKNLKILSPSLFKQIDRYISILEESDAFKTFKDVGYYLEEDECFDMEEVEVPKALGDIFESVAGAVYLDSGMSLDTVWKVFYPMLRPSLEHLSRHVPKSPVRKLYELLQRTNIFEEYEGEEMGKSYVLVRLPDGKEFVGVGPNKKVAKRSAAKRALQYLQKQ